MLLLDPLFDDVLPVFELLAEFDDHIEAELELGGVCCCGGCWWWC